ncbi:unnamed protein product [Linum tenue]|uniref:peroxidase n=1 Tax=Linum tenue TaxID=586396 RepID=A0AAV0QVX3_9ROSI|nr:unnamed protein product [Linum tenue]
MATFHYFLLLLLISSVAVNHTQAQLTTNFYASSCPNALSTIRTSIRTGIARERRMAASLLRLHFHDCFVQGCDASILLDQSPTITTEKTAPPNDKSARGYQLIDAAKAQLERICPGVVSCADVLAVAAKEASAYVGGPAWDVKLGRRDSTARRRCPAVGGDDALAPLDLVTPNSFDNNYFRDLVQRKGLLVSDQVLYSGGSTNSIVEEYSRSPSRFSADFAAAMVRMGDIQPLMGSAGQIRRICGAVN